MVYLIAALLCSAMVSIVLKISSRWSYDRFGMLTVNYFACLIPFLISQLGHPLPAMDRDLGICIIFALTNGVLYLAGMIMNQVNVKRNGAILQSASFKARTSFTPSPVIATVFPASFST